MYNSFRRVVSGSTLLELILGIMVLSIGLMGILNTINFVMQKSVQPTRQLMNIRIAESTIRDTFLRNVAGDLVVDPSGIENANNGLNGSYSNEKNVMVSVVNTNNYTGCAAGYAWVTATVSPLSSQGVNLMTLNACLGVSS